MIRNYQNNSESWETCGISKNLKMVKSKVYRRDWTHELGLDPDFTASRLRFLSVKNKIATTQSHE